LENESFFYENSKRDWRWRKDIGLGEHEKMGGGGEKGVLLFCWRECFTDIYVL
jgi:hypothetical protein